MNLDISRWHDDQWIRQQNERFSHIALENHREYMFKENQRESHKRGQKKYESSEKGKLARKKVEKNRKIRERNSPLATRGRMRMFYKDCPEGFSVDHIIPLSKGGKHCLSNLQYLKKQDNQRKGCKIIYPIFDHPQCLIRN